MFISRKRWNEMERRISALEKKKNSKTFSLERAKEAMKTALSNAEYRFEYELTKNQESGRAVRFSTNPKQDSAL
ncbi:MAG: hypothetical protein HFG41_05695 [Coprococcus sp.]|nr:hypothetical protein [Coprococcus sp.]